MVEICDRIARGNEAGSLLSLGCFKVSSCTFIHFMIVPSNTGTEIWRRSRGLGLLLKNPLLLLRYESKGSALRAGGQFGFLCAARFDLHSGDSDHNATAGAIPREEEARGTMILTAQQTSSSHLKLKGSSSKLHYLTLNRLLPTGIDRCQVDLQTPDSCSLKHTS